MADVVTGEDAKVWIGNESCTTLMLADFSLSADRDITEQSQMCKSASYKTQGPLSIDGSLTHAKLLHKPFIDSVINGTVVTLSGTTDGSFPSDSGASFAFSDAQITTWDLDESDASSVTTASVDFTILDASTVGTDPSGSNNFISGASTA